MPTPIDTTSTTIAIDLAPVQRRFRHQGRPEEVLTEGELRSTSTSILLLGDPGSGKTTALKRLTLAMFDEIPLGPEEDLAFPLVVVCREVDWSTHELSRLVAERFGVDLRRVLTLLEAPESDGLVFVAELMDQAKCLLILDGLDEVAPKHRTDLVGTVERLQRLLSLSRIVCSSRSGNAPHLEGFVVLELLPLTPGQRAEIVSRRLDDGVGFFERVEQSGIDEQLLDRPLFLNHLVRVFEATQSIPDRPSDLYGQLVRLMIHEWDEQRRVRGRSEVKGINATTMDAILGEIAFQLTQRELSVFTDSDLRGVVAEIGDSYELGTRDGRMILREIEAQSGFIVESSSGFEFSHVTLQEHLCARNIVLRPNHRSIERLLRQNPEIAAVAVALSSRPTDWMLERIHANTFDTPGQMAQFVDRLGQERPRFNESSDLGARLLQMMSNSRSRDVDAWRRIARVDSARGSVGRALRPYHRQPAGELTELSVRREREDADSRRVPRYRVPSPILQLFTGESAT
jgi:energy-coupling factor transporter ATP-binding protein EcfA2